MKQKPDIRLRKPATLSLLYQLDDGGEEQQLKVTMVAGFSLTPEAELLDEGEFWPVVKGLNGSAPFDLGTPKPAGEFLLSGSCYPPGGRMALACPLHVRVGTIEKNLVVFGDRYWKTGTGMTFPQPFRAMELGWERSFGGQLDQDNPQGRGNRKDSLLLPNIEHPARLITSPRDRPPPSGFGPEGLDWPSHRPLAGTLDENWLGRSWPGLPADVNPTLFHLAPRDQRLSGFFQGDEEIEIRNMHPEQARIRSQLPQVRCRCFLGNQGLDSEHRFQELQCRMDTLWLFPELATGILIWRGIVQLQPGDSGQQMLAATLEPTAQPGMEPSACYLAIIGQPELEAEEIAKEIPEESATEHSSKKSDKQKKEAAKADIDPVAAAVEEKTAAARAKLTPLLASFGISVDELLKPSKASKKPGLDKKLTPARLEQRAIGLQGKLDTMLSRSGLSPGDIKPGKMVDKPKANTGARIATAIGAMQSFGIKDEALFAEMRELERQTDILRQGTDTKAAALVRPLSNLPVTATMTREEVIAAWERGESLAGVDLGGLDLSALQLDGIDCRDAILEGVNLSNSSLRGAVLDRAVLTGADLNGACLARAAMTACVAMGVTARGADFSKADLSQARFERADLHGVKLTKCKGNKAGFIRCIMTEVQAQQAGLTGACFSGSDLGAASFIGAELQRADFSRTLLDRCDFSRANLAKCWLGEAQGDEVIFVKSNLNGSKCNGTRLQGADFSKADLAQAAWLDSDFSSGIFRGAVLDRAMAVRCDFRQADLSRCSFKEANLMHSDLRQTSFFRANGFKARFRHVRLEESDCRQANLYGVDFFRASLRRTLLDDANLDATLLTLRLPQ